MVKRVCVVGSGYVGLVTGSCLADLGNNVICVDNDKKKIEMLNKFKMPIYEPGLEDVVKRNVEAGRLFFTTDLKDSVKKSEVIFIAVGTPPKANGEADLSCIEDVSKQIALNMDEYRLIVDKSTVPVQTGQRVKETITRNLKKDIEFDVASNPEFLKEGSAINDFTRPDRIVIGVETERAAVILKEIYNPFNSPIITTDIQSAELIKHAANSFLATKVSFVNALSVICELTGADVDKVTEGMGMDKRIGSSFLNAGVGFGGFCFPKDLAAFIKISEKLGYDFKLLKAVEEINKKQKDRFIKKIEDALWNIKDKTIAVLGLSFKPNTDDIRFAPSIDIIKALLRDGAGIRAYDPYAMDKMSQVLPEVKYCQSSYEAADGADALVIVTEWSEFKELDFVKIKGLLNDAILIDGRNMYDPDSMRRLGFKYVCIGKKS
ncbi:MAG: UDP-glucose/GDP-mannose dehydrogenase family protein [Candidatus Omnitrophica bacterium]|nr:UDP-glucose/GDP-mannose dehydrogenase family protein [Candidatus Omnitrophota bacterium]